MYPLKSVSNIFNFFQKIIKFVIYQKAEEQDKHGGSDDGNEDLPVDRRADAAHYGHVQIHSTQNQIERLSEWCQQNSRVEEKPFPIWKKSQDT